MFGKHKDAMKHFAKLQEIIQSSQTEEEAKQRTIAYLEGEGLELPAELLAMKKPL